MRPLLFREEVWPPLALVLLIVLGVVLSLQWSDLAWATPQDPAPAQVQWPQVTRVIHPEDLDRCP